MTEQNPAPSAPSGSSAQNVLSFRIADQDYCLDLGLVREIRGWTPATLVPQSYPWVTGVINLRGAVVVVIDMAARLGLGATVAGPRHVIIVTMIRSQPVGLLVDVVSDIVPLHEEMISHVPEVAAELGRDFITGIATMPDGRLLRRIDILKITSDPQANAA